MNTKMKVLSLALIGAFGYVGSAAAGTCPAGPTVPDGGAWTSSFVSTGSAFAIEAGGLEPSSPSACKATSALAASITAAATVTDDTPADEESYRFQFLVDPTAFGSFGVSDSVVVFRANSTAAANGRLSQLVVYLVPGPAGAKRLRFVASCNNAPSFFCAQSFGTDLPAGVSRVEGKLTTGVGAAGQFDFWVNAAQGTTEPAASGTIASLDNDAWVGVSRAILGLAAPTTSFKNAHANQAAGFDAFDSRRVTYIGW